jgi:hypothetical protein
MSRPSKVNSESQKELDKVEEQFEKFDEEVKALTLDRMNMAPKQEVEPQTKIANRDLDKMKDIYLKPERTISSQEKFNEKFREGWNFDKEFVQFIAENKEIIGESIECWTKTYPGVPCEFWRVPVNKPVWGPRYLAEQIKKCSYHRLVMDQRVQQGSDGMGTYYGAMAVDTTVQRLDATPVTKRRSIFMGDRNF